MKRRKYFVGVLAVLFLACILGIMMHKSEHRIKMTPEISEGQAAAREAVKNHAGEDAAGGAGDEETLQTAAVGEAEHAEASQSVSAAESEHKEPVEPVTLDRAECEAGIQMLLEENRNEISEWFEKYPLWQRRVDFIAIYEGVTQKEGWDVELILVEWDTRDEASRDKNVQVGYGVYTEFSQEEKDVFMRKNYYEGILEVLHAKEANGTTQQISEYEQIYENLEMREVVYLGCLLEWEEGMQWAQE